MHGDRSPPVASSTHTFPALSRRARSPDRIAHGRVDGNRDAVGLACSTISQFKKSTAGVRPRPASDRREHRALHAAEAKADREKELNESAMRMRGFNGCRGNVNFTGNAAGSVVTRQ